VVPALVDVVLSLPGAPALGSVGDSRGDVLDIRRLRGFLRLGWGPAHREAEPVALGDCEGRAQRRVLELERHGRADVQAAGAERASAAVLEPDQRRDQAVLRPRRELELHLDLARDAFERAQQLMRGVVADVVPALALRERHGVREPQLAGLGGEDGLDDERAGEVAPCRSIRPGRADPPVAGVGVEQPGEDGVAVVARQAQPVDRPVGVDERGRVAVRQQTVVGDRLRGPPATRARCPEVDDDARPGRLELSRYP
jgi:hypothetical protein